MITQIFSIPVNPEAWKVPPAYRAGKKGVRFGQDAGNEAFKQAVKEEVLAAGGYMMRPEYSLNIYTSRQLVQYMSSNNRTITKKRSDATNMQKLIEDALKGVILEDDDTVIDIHTHQIHQAVTAMPMIVLVVRGELVSQVFGDGDPRWLQMVPADVRIEVERSYEMARIRQNAQEINASDIERANRW